MSFMLLMTAFLSDAFAYWPIVFQVAKEGQDFASFRGPLRLINGGIGVDPNRNSTETSVSYKLVLQEFISFKKETLKAIEAYLQIYPADVRSFEYGKSGDVLFNGAMVKKFNLTLTHDEEKFFFDESNYRFNRSRLDFPIPMYGYFANQSMFVRVPVELLDTQIIVTIRMDPNVLWEVYIISVIVRMIPEAISPWWLENLPTVYIVGSVELISAALIILRLRKLLRNKESRSNESLP